MATKKRFQKASRVFADGGPIDPFAKMGATELAQYTNDPDALNAATSRDIAARDAATQGFRGPGTGYQSYSGAQVAGQPESSMRTVSPLIDAALKPQATQPVGTTFQQDSDARQSRITGYADKLRGMEQAGRTNSLMGSSSLITKPLVGYADGGVPSETPEQLMARMSAKYGVPASAPAPVPPSGPMAAAVSKMAPAPQPVVQPPQGIVGLMRNRAAQIDQAAGYAQGGKPRGLIREVLGDPYVEAEDTGARIVGPGTSTSDSIPAVVGGTGEPIRVANGERIVSVAQDHALEGHARSLGFDSLDDFLRTLTGKPVGPTLRDGQRAAVYGLDTADYGNEGRVTRRDIAFPGQQHLTNIDTRGPNEQAAGYEQNNLEARGLQLLQRNTGAGDPDMVSKGVRTMRQADTNAPMTTWTSTTDAAAQSIGRMGDGSYIKPEDGTGTISFRQGNGSYKNVVLDRPQYTAADGSQTSDWSRTAQYAQGMAQAQKDRDTLAMMQRNRLERDAYGSDITDPTVQANARAQIAEMDAKAAKAGEAQGRMLDNQLKQTDLASKGMMAGLQAQYLAETDPARREAYAERIRAAQGKGTAPAPVNLQHVETEQGTMIFDPRTGQMRPAVGTDGAPVGGGKPLTEYQGKSTGFGMRAQKSSQIIDEVGKGGKVQPSLIKRFADDVPLVGGALGMAANKLQSSEQQQIEQAQRDFVNAVLRQESGAAISASEFNNAKTQYFPQPGDSEQVIAQKKANREMAIKGFQIAAGPGGKHIGGVLQQAQQSGPKVGTVEDGHVFQGGDPGNPANWKAVQ